MGLGDVGLGDVGLRDARRLGKVINKQHLTFALNLQNIISVVSRKLFYARELVSSSRWFSAFMVRPNMFDCLFDRENWVPNSFNTGGLETVKNIVGSYGGLSW